MAAREGVCPCVSLCATLTIGQPTLSNDVGSPEGGGDFFPSLGMKIPVIQGAEEKGGGYSLILMCSRISGYGRIYTGKKV
jgi:hypothetical protein